MSPAELGSRLSATAERLRARRAWLAATALPSAAALGEIAAEMTAAGAELAGWETAVDGWSAAERADALKRLRAVRQQLAVVARLVAGSAWFAALAREAAGGAKPSPGLYAATGQPAAPAGRRRVERKI